MTLPLFGRELPGAAQQAREFLDAVRSGLRPDATAAQITRALWHTGDLVPHDVPRVADDMEADLQRYVLAQRLLAGVALGVFEASRREIELALHEVGDPVT